MVTAEINTKEELFAAFTELGATTLAKYELLYNELEQFCRNNKWGVRLVDEYYPILKERQINDESAQLENLINGKYAEYGEIKLSEFGFIYWHEYWDDKTNSSDGGAWRAEVTQKVVTSKAKGDLGGEFLSILYRKIYDTLSPFKQSDFWEGALLENGISHTEGLPRPIKNGTLLSSYTLKKVYYQYL
jgi:hypothetical protein